jgi:1,4-alpha-glucan branching enzyme
MLPDEEPQEHVAAGAPPRLGEPAAWVPQADLDRFAAGQHRDIQRLLGAHPRTDGRIHGVRFATWAPHAAAVSVVGDFNDWAPDRHPLSRRGQSGVWETFVPGIGVGAHYRFAVLASGGGNDTSPDAADAGAARYLARPDPYAHQFTEVGSDIAEVTPETPYPWEDSAWLEARRSRNWHQEPVAIYEVDLGSWPRTADGEPLGYRSLAEEVTAHATALAFTHLELLPLGERAGLDPDRYAAGSLFAPTRRFGTGEDFRFFVDHCHRHGIGVLLDWPIACLAQETPGLSRFDGRPLYEQPPFESVAVDRQGPPLFDYARGEVRSLLISSALFWLRELHVDGLRVPVMACMLYLDYARGERDWAPNKYGGNENLEAIAFLRELTDVVRSEVPGALLIAEESSAWPQVTRPPWVGGLGFNLRWSGGWMHDTLEYFSQDPVYRHYHHDMLTFSPLYAFKESYVLPLSREEVAGRPGALLERMPGDTWQRYANLRLLYTYLWTFPGKKLLFMGGELGFPPDGGQPSDGAPGYDGAAAGIEALIRDLNHLYRESPPLHHQELSHRGFEWIDRHDAPQSIIAYLRRDGDAVVVVALNFTPVLRHQYRIGVPFPGVYREVLNSDSAYYGGSNLGNMGNLRAEPVPWMGRPYSLSIVLPPLAGVVVRPAAQEVPAP